MKVIYVLNAHTHTGMAEGSQKELCAVFMGTEGRVTSPAGHLVELMEK